MRVLAFVAVLLPATALAQSFPSPRFDHMVVQPYGLAPSNSNHAIYAYWSNSIAATSQTTSAAVQGFVDDLASGGQEGFWGVIGRANFDGTTNKGRPFIGVEGQGVLGANAALTGPSNTPPVWGVIADAVDFTKAKSSQTSALTGIEDDMETNNVDDDNQRQVLTVLLVDHAAELNPPVSAIAPRAFAGIDITTDEPAGGNNYIGYKFPIRISGNVGTAAIDLRTAALNDVDSGTSLQVASPGTTGTVVPVTDVYPFTDDAFGKDLNVSGNGHTNATVTINGHTYSETGYSITGTGPAGTITVTSAVGPDGTTGNSLSAGGHEIWLGTGQDIAFDWAGTNNQANVRIYGDNTNLHVQGGLAVTGAETVGGAFAATGSVTSQGGFFSQANSTFTDSAGSWSSYNVGHQLLITGTDNPGVAITDNAGANLAGIFNNGGLLTLAGMPAYTDPTTAPKVYIQMSAAGGVVFGETAGIPLIVHNLPTSCSGQPSESLWKNGSTISICP